MTSMAKQALYGKTLLELQAIVDAHGLPPFTARQLAQWLYKSEVWSIDEMTNISKDNRSLLKASFDVGRCSPVKVQTSVDGTRKYLFSAGGDKYVETATIPDQDRLTVCVSTQVGCKMGCLFCMTGKQGFGGQLSAGEIVNQIRSIDNAAGVTNIVYMGMGEPLDNLNEVLRSIDILTAEWGYAMSPRRITVSTIGVLPAMKTFLDACECGLAISMHTPFEKERQQLMPAQMAWPLSRVLKEVRGFDFGRQRKLSFEYIVFAGLNDTPAHVKELARILNGIRSHINLIRFHAIPNSPLQTTDEGRLQQFKDAL
ncbi:MAG: 23S rRNA (adenine(2503)-C(2))-methyltransferase RlmN, partial [Deltaproteobacteria bacterium]|nr:23S rRNA (adenine(2503)-C(2))-methyltransferase RlmN [Deltaproteobacteria bacterium]